MWRTRLATVLAPLCGLFLLTGLVTTARAQQEPAKQIAPQGKLSAYALSGRIDRHISARWNKEGVKPVGPADDSTFFRRVHLDLVGRIPQIDHVSDYLEDDRPDKQKIWVDKLLDSEAFAEHFSNIYRTLILPQVENQQAQFLIGGFDKWLQKKLQENTPFNTLVHELLTSSNRQNFNQPNDFNNPSPAAFYAANENKPENLAGASARLFLGVKIECAQCHKHPFADWTRTQFWEFAAFFQNIDGNNGLAQPVPIDEKGQPAKKVEPKNPNEGPTIAIPKTDQVVKAKFLDGTAPKWAAGMDPRKEMADWITSKANPYFAKITVNQLWHYFYGTGLVDPFDDFGEHNPASHEELLDELAEQFVQNGYDLKYVIRAIVHSKTYQLGSRPLSSAQKKEDDEPESLRLFTRMPLRALTGEQIFDSLALVMDYKVDRTKPAFSLVPTPREEFVSKFASPENKRVDVHSSILQALHLMNGKFMANATSLEKNKNLKDIVDSNVDVASKVSTLYRMALSRQPRPEELNRMVRYVTGNKDQGQALADVLWVLLNSAEFTVNH